MSRKKQKKKSIRSYLAVKPLSGGGTHQDKRFKRLRTRSAKLRKELNDC
jgi:hypothetical protein